MCVCVCVPLARSIIHKNDDDDVDDDGVIVFNWSL